jgi:hypothetical protein
MEVAVLALAGTATAVAAGVGAVPLFPLPFSFAFAARAMLAPGLRSWFLRPTSPVAGSLQLRAPRPERC